MAWGPSQHGGVRQARSHTGAILLGAMTEGCEGWHEWPIDPARLPEAARRDAEQARRLAEYIGVADRATWGFYVWKANQLARRSAFRRLAVAIADELERVEAPDGRGPRGSDRHHGGKWRTEV